ncbi:glutaredoxin family protein [Rhodococcoides trifolii]|uniref:glutaredoxin family protein n=1 Tax=Rhodococcoides trifolii TaxID=908250 RepID=UPI00227A8E62|nr:glutaredoxin family protein [Rhodococcus trifolii]
MTATKPDSQMHGLILLTREGCASCVAARSQLEAIGAEYGLTVTVIDVDEAASTDPELRAEYGDRLPVVLLDGAEHSYWDVDEVRLRRDLTGR